MSDLFGDYVIQKGQLQRAAITFGKPSSQKPGSEAHRRTIYEEIQRHDESKGGIWNYDDLFGGLVELTKGGSEAKLRECFSGCRGKGEAVSKLAIFDKLLNEIPICKGVFVDVGAREVNLGDGVVLPIQYDCSFKVEKEVFCVFVYPRSTPMKEIASDAIIAEFSQPFEGMTENYKLVFAESPIISGARRPSVKVFDFDYRKIDSNFREHLRISRLAMG